MNYKTKCGRNFVEFADFTLQENKNIYAHTTDDEVLLVCPIYLGDEWEFEVIDSEDNIYLDQSEIKGLSEMEDMDSNFLPTKEQIDNHFDNKNPFKKTISVFKELKVKWIIHDSYHHTIEKYLQILKKTNQNEWFWVSNAENEAYDKCILMANQGILQQLNTYSKLHQGIVTLFKYNYDMVYEIPKHLTLQ